MENSLIKHLVNRKKKYSYYITTKIYFDLRPWGGKCKVEFGFRLCRVQSLQSAVLVWISDRVLKNECWSPTRIRDFCLRSSVWAHKVSYSMGNDGYFSGLKHTPNHLHSVKLEVQLKDTFFRLMSVYYIYCT